MRTRVLVVALAAAFATAVPIPRARSQQAGEAPAHDFRPGGPIPDAELGQYYAELDCSVEGGPTGTLVLEMWPEEAPATVRNFLRYCAEGFYDGVGFHRVLRDFMVQGGDPTGKGTGSGPYGNIPDEFSDDPRWAHGYGVISMAHSGRPGSASCQFFICTADTMNVFKLDGKYASFGKLASGVATLEAMANVEVTRSATGETSRPTRKITIVDARVKKGEPAVRETIARPQPSFGDEPAKVVVQHVLVSFSGAQGKRSERTKEEAAALAATLLERARAGEDFSELVRAQSDDAADPVAELPGVYRLLNRGAFDVASERAKLDVERETTLALKDLEERHARGEIDRTELGRLRQDLQIDANARMLELRWIPRTMLVAGFADACFELAPGEVTLVPWDAKRAPFGWHVVKRIE